MNFLFRDKAIGGLLTVVPAQERLFLDEMKRFNAPEARSRKLAEVMGYDRHRIVREDTCASDLAVHGLQHLFDHGLLGRDDFDAMIVVTQSPDYLVPATSNVIQGRLELRQDILCLDINQGCAGFVIGLLQAFLLLEQPSVRRVVLINVDVLSRKVSPMDRNSYPLTGDAASICIVERGSVGAIHANVKMDGSRCQALIIPAGGFRTPSSPETAAMEDAGEGNIRSKDNLRMDGSAVFNFVQVEVPPMIESLLAAAAATSADVDYYVFHQPNRFMLQKLADKMQVPHAKMPMNVVERFGNSSGVTIPVAMVHNLAGRLLQEPLRLCLAGFGVGLTWASIYMPVGPLRFCAMTEYP